MLNRTSTQPSTAIVLTVGAFLVHLVFISGGLYLSTIALGSHLWEPVELSNFSEISPDHSD